MMCGIIAGDVLMASIRDDVSKYIQVELRKPFTDGRNIKLDVVAHYANTY